MEQQEIMFSGITTADHATVSKEDREIFRNKKSVYQEWVFAPAWSDCPIEVEEEVKKLWDDYYLEQDEYHIHIVGGDENGDEYPLISEWCRRNGVPEKEEVAIRYWW